MSVNTKGASGGHKKPSLPNSSNPDCPPETDLPHYHRSRSFNSNEEAKKTTNAGNTVANADTASLSGGGGECEKEQKVFSVATSSSESRPLKPDSKYIAKSISNSQSSGGVNKASSSDSERAEYQEKQSSYRVDFSKVRSAPPPSRQQWWYPDPYTGYYVPEDHFGEVSPALPEEKPKKKKNVTVVLKHTKGSGTKGSLWWTSMEDLPDSLS